MKCNLNLILAKLNFGIRTVVIGVCRAHSHRRSGHLGRGNVFFVLSQLVKHSEQLWMLEKVSSALNTTPTTMPQTPHISKNPQ